MREIEFGSVADGEAFVELDGYDNSGMIQQINTSVGQTYTLSFDYSPRPGVAANSNGIEVWWNDELIDTITEEGGSSTSWTTYTYQVEGSNNLTTGLEFRAVGNSDGKGGFLDNVRVHLLDGNIGWVNQFWQRLSYWQR